MAVRPSKDWACPDQDWDYSEGGLSGANFDQPPASAQLNYAICSSQRSGSFLLCRLLARMGVGIPHEYFNPMNMFPMCKRWGIEAPAFTDALKERRTINGIFGAKLQWWEYETHYGSHDDLITGGFKLIYLFREDVLKQAISLHMARLTGQWGDDDVVSTRPMEGELLDHVSVERQLIDIFADETAWRGFFARNHLRPLWISYEQLVADRTGTLAKVISFLGLNPEDFDLTVPGEPTAPLRTDKSQKSAKILSDYLEKRGSGLGINPRRTLMIAGQKERLRRRVRRLTGRG